MVNNQISSYFNYPSSNVQQLSTTTMSTVHIPEQLELIKCSLCEQAIDMYIDIDADVFKRFYCVSCIRNKKITPFLSKDVGVHVTPTKHEESHVNHNIDNASKTKSQACQSNFSSPSFTSRSAAHSQIQKCSKMKQKSYMTPLFVPCDECCSPPVITCSRGHHYIDEVPSQSMKHTCERSVNKRSWAVNNRRPWSNEQKETIFSYFSEQIKSHASIGKEDIIPLMQMHKDLYEDRTWKEIKWVYYHHLKVLEKRKSSLHSGNVAAAIDSIASGNVRIVS